MSADKPKGPAEHWTVEEAEDLLRTLDGVISARLIITPKGKVEEVHLLTTAEVSPKATVRNVESALRARFDLTIDHRKVSVARSHRPSTRLAEPTQRLAEPTQGAAEPAHGTTQASQPVVQPQVSQQHVPQTQVAQTQQPTQIPPQESAGVPTSGHSAPATPRQPTPSSRASGELRIETPIETPRPGVVDQGVIESPWAAPVQDTAVPRLVFVRHRQERERSRRIKMSVELEWAGRVFSGSASTVDVPKARLEATVEATLRAVEAAVEGSGGRISFEVEGTEIINALDHSYALVSVHSISSGRFAPLTGVVGISSDPELAAILATLRATERPVRVLLGGAMRRAAAKDTTSAEPDPTPSTGDPLKLWGRP